ncbi:hypothetical protein PC112_g22002 [Phytophthora cactorum]|nr:hypothetical protein PC112_g22002 [Phytophthora cactorum]
MSHDRTPHSIASLENARPNISGNIRLLAPPSRDTPARSPTGSPPGLSSAEPGLRPYYRDGRVLLLHVGTQTSSSDRV